MAIEDEMDLEPNKPHTPPHSFIASKVRPVDKLSFQRFQKLFVRKRFMKPVPGRQLHRTGGIGLLRAAVLGANDGILSTSSLVLGVAAAHGTHHSILVAGIAGLVSGAMSMAASEYVSVHSQADIEAAALSQERAELQVDFAGERRELTEIYVRRGLDVKLAGQVAEQLMAHDALGAHARDELGLSPAARARPVQAALASAGSFATGAVLPLLLAAWAPQRYRMLSVVAVSLVCLLLLGGWSAKVGGADIRKGALRVAFWSALAMAVTSLIGAISGSLGGAGAMG